MYVFDSTIERFGEYCTLRNLTYAKPILSKKEFLLRNLSEEMVFSHTAYENPEYEEIKVLYFEGLLKNKLNSINNIETKEEHKTTKAILINKIKTFLSK
jgi:hypothetical protein